MESSESERSREEIVGQFAEYVADYKARVIRCSSSEVEEAIVGALSDRGSGQVIVPPDLPTSWGSHGEMDAGHSHRALATMQAVVTGCAVGIAETGTIVLDCGVGQGRRVLSLIPDHHVCVVLEDQVVDSVPEAIERLTESALAGRPQTWISGPSATSDIELDRVEGVHGPRILDVILVK
jgi:L-lactate dehydrogenase complex protein LldG